MKTNRNMKKKLTFIVLMLSSLFTLNLYAKDDICSKVDDVCLCLKSNNRWVYFKSGVLFLYDKSETGIAWLDYFCEGDKIVSELNEFNGDMKIKKNSVTVTTEDGVTMNYPIVTAPSILKSEVISLLGNESSNSAKK